MMASASRMRCALHPGAHRIAAPSCSAFQARSGSSEWVVRTKGTLYSFFAKYPAIDTYQVWVWTMSMPARAFTCVRLRLKASRAPLNLPLVPFVISSHGSAPRTCRLPVVGVLRTPAMHFHLDFLSQFAAQVIDVDSGATVHVGRELSCE